METPILQCLAAMVDAHTDLNQQKVATADRCADAYKDYGATVEFGDDPPSQKALEKLAKASATDKTDKFSNDLKDQAKALLQCTGEASGLLPGMEV